MAAAAVAAALLALAATGQPAWAGGVNLTGKWACDFEGTYYIRQVGKTVWWLGKSKNDGQDWSNVFRGEIKGRQITGEWADVPQGGATGTGTLTLELIIRDGAVVEIRRTRTVGDPFGSGVWRRLP
jgi:hypothetical protein